MVLAEDRIRTLYYAVLTQSSRPAYAASRASLRALASAGLRRSRRWLMGVAVLSAFLAVLHWGARRAVASALAYAPNSDRIGARPGTLPLSAGLRERGAFTLEVAVGPPNATLEAWVVLPRGARSKGTIVLLHGVRTDKRSLIGMGQALSDAGYRAVLVDLRGHGESSGRFLTYGQVEAKDVSSVLDALEARGTELGCTGAYGFSYGASVAIELGARDRRIRSVVAVAPFSTLREVIGDYRQKYLPPPLSSIPDAWFQAAIDDAATLADFDPVHSAPLLAAARSSANLLLIHGLGDTQVPLRHSQALFGAARGNACLLTVPGADHATMPSDPTGVVRRQTVAWFDHWFEQSADCSVPPERR